MTIETSQKVYYTVHITLEKEKRMKEDLIKQREKLEELAGVAMLKGENLGENADVLTQSRLVDEMVIAEMEKDEKEKEKT